MKFEKEFFSDEEREGFLVPQMMKRAWSAALEILEVFDDVCKKNNIRYFAAYGTLLGAVRHKGFIPWDDDIDVCMLREDYDRFLEIAPSALPKGFVLSGIYGSCERLWEANKMQQARVIADETLINLPDYMSRFHGFPYQRIGIDIFPFSYVPKDKKESYDLIDLYYALNFTDQNLELYRKEHKFTKRIKELEERTGTKFKKDTDAILHHELRLAGDNLIKANKREDCDMVFDAMWFEVPDRYEDFKGFDDDVYIYKKEWFDETVYLPFESIKIPAPKNYHEVLVKTYHEDYMTPRMFTAEHDYPFYNKQEAAFLQLLKESGIDTPVDTFCTNWQKMIGEL